MQKSQSTFPSDGAQVQHFVLLHFLLDLHISFFFLQDLFSSLCLYIYIPKVWHFLPPWLPIL